MMDEKQFTISLKCFFCDCQLEADTKKEFTSGDMILCLNCGELNDYDALLDVVKEEGEELIRMHGKKEIEKSLKKYFK